MVDRIFLGFDAGSPIFRVTKPGKDISSTDPDDFICREDMETLRPVLQGTVSFGGSGTINIALSGFTAPPFVLLKASDNRMPHYYDYRAQVNNSYTNLAIVNAQGRARSIDYYVFRNTM